MGIVRFGLRTSGLEWLGVDEAMHTWDAMANDAMGLQCQCCVTSGKVIFTAGMEGFGFSGNGNGIA